MTRRWPAIGVALAVLWVFVRGPPLTPKGLVGELLPGLVFGLPTAYALRGFYNPTVSVRGLVRATPAVLAYAGSFGKELLTANVDVAYRVLAPSMPIEPAVVEVPLRVETDLAITTLANSITLTPGTLTMDYDAETNTLYVHAITGTDRAAVVDPIRSWEEYALRIFDEPADPGTEVPHRPSVRATTPAPEGTDEGEDPERPDRSPVEQTAGPDGDGSEAGPRTDGTGPARDEGDRGGGRDG